MHKITEIQYLNVHLHAKKKKKKNILHWSKNINVSYDWFYNGFKNLIWAATKKVKTFIYTQDPKKGYLKQIS